MYEGRASRQIVTLFEQAAWFESSLGKVAALTRYQTVRCAWTKRSLSRDVADTSDRIGTKSGQ
jgi:hypothetical protein